MLLWHILPGIGMYTKIWLACDKRKSFETEWLDLFHVYKWIDLKWYMAWIHVLL